MGSNWFLDIIEEGVRRHGGKVAPLAREWDIDRTTIDRWRAGTHPTQPNIEKVLSLVGGDIRRALPDYRPQGDIEERALAYINHLRKENALLKRRLAKIRELAGDAEPPANVVPLMAADIPLPKDLPPIEL